MGCGEAAGRLPDGRLRAADAVWPAAARPTIGRIPTHYEILGVPTDAPLSDIRASYRARARLHHPDRAAAGTPGEVASERPSMAQINEAYRVLSDPGRRAMYDRTLRPVADGVPRSSLDIDDDDGDLEQAIRPTRRNPLIPEGPARFPWKAMLLLAAVGSALVLVSAALADPPGVEPPDGIIQTDSCVTIEPNGDAREVACTGEDDLVVELLIPTGARCPVGMEPHRDRLGLGIACVVP